MQSHLHTVEGVQMDKNEKEQKCSLCGITASGNFVGDICPACDLPFWKCQSCGYTITAPAPPEACPECSQPCDFVNITSYTPDFGGSGNIDPRL